jgi:ATP-binding cassette subfamily F protein 3
MSFEEAERRLRGLHAPIDRPPRLNLHLRSGMRSGNLVLRSRDLLVGYPGNPLFTAPDLELRRLECAALIGPNGAGKSTFLKTILDQMPPLQGEVILGASLKISYFAQAHEGLHDERSLMEEIESIAPHLLPGQVRDYLARFLFRGEDVFKQVGMLSGGERGRLALAKLAMSDSNLLLLDEPTNHLDIPSQEILQAVLDEYQGTILLVSHDRYLIDALATQVWEIDDQARTLTVFSGTYSQYRAEKDAQAQAAAAAGNGGPRPREDYRQKLREKNRSQAEERRRKARLDEVEARIAALESELRLLTVRLENPPADPGELRRLARQYESFNQELEARLAEWETLHEEAVEDPA